MGEIKGRNKLRTILRRWPRGRSRFSISGVFSIRADVPAVGKVLCIYHSGIKAILIHQGMMISRFYDFAVVEHDDLVGIADGGKTVGDYECGSMPGEMRNGILNKHLCFRVNR